MTISSRHKKFDKRLAMVLEKFWVYRTASIAAVVLPILFITPLAYMYLRAPVILNQFIGQVFQAGVSQLVQMRTLAPFAR